MQDEEFGESKELGFHQCNEDDRDHFYEQAIDGQYDELEDDFFAL